MGIYEMNYTPVGDILTMAVCVLNLILLKSSYRLKQKSLRIYLNANLLILLAAIPDIIYHKMLEQLNLENRLMIVELRDLTFILLIFVFYVFMSYVCNLMELEKKWNRHVHMVNGIAFILYLIVTILQQLVGFGFYIEKDLTYHNVIYQDVFWYAYLFYVAQFAVIMIRHKQKMITKLYWCLVNVVVFSVMTVGIQLCFKQSSFTTFTFTMPLTAALFLFHHSPFDQETGTLDSKAFMGYVDELRSQDFTIIHLYLRDMSMDKVFILSEDFYHFNEKFFVNPLTFRMRDNKMLMIYENKKNPDGEKRQKELLDAFGALYDKYQMDYRMVITKNFREIKSGAEYYDLIEFVEEEMENNSIYRISQHDVDEFMKYKYVDEQLLDIYKNADLNDDRVLVYCQPVLNAVTGKFTTAEALMRLQLPRTGMVYPDIFIPIAEKNDYIHCLSRIILNKTAAEIRRLMDEGFEIQRISVNFSVQELHHASFCDEVLQIIEQNNIPYDKIAIELTESRNEQDFEMMRRTMLKLQDYGIRFYLDDFGTGYSNFERIMGLPIDIIKFDRSMTILSAKDEASQFMVGAFSNIFKKSDYQVLFEGVETDGDEQRCKDMKAVYLQGYKYSRPIPIATLREFLDKTL